MSNVPKKIYNGKRVRTSLRNYREDIVKEVLEGQFSEFERRYLEIQKRNRERGKTNFLRRNH